MINRHRLLVAVGAALAVVPAAALKGTPWWVVACSAVGVFCATLAKPEEVASPTPKPPTETP